MKEERYEELIKKAFHQFTIEIGTRRFYILGDSQDFLKSQIETMNFGGYVLSPNQLPPDSHLLLIEKRNYQFNEDYNYHLIFGSLKKEEIPKIRYSRIYLGEDSE